MAFGRAFAFDLGAGVQLSGAEIAAVIKGDGALLELDDPECSEPGSKSGGFVMSLRDILNALG